MTRPTPARARLLALALAPALGGCDAIYIARARVPLVAPMASACLRSTLPRGAQHRLRTDASSAADSARTGGVEAFVGDAMFHNAWENAAQTAQRDSGVYRGVAYRDSAFALGADAVRINRRFTQSDGPLTGAELVGHLLAVRDACGGRSPADEPLFIVDVDETPFHAWALGGAGGRAAMRLTVEGRRYWLQQIVREPGRYALHLDTLASDADPRHPRWLQADSATLPTPAKGEALATRCWRDGRDGLASAEYGDIVALVRATDTPYFADARAAWTGDAASHRVREIVPADGIRCENPQWGAVLPGAPRALRQDALRFRPASGASRIYVLLARPDFPIDIAMPHVLVDGQVVGRIEGGSFLMVELPPGRHRVSTPRYRGQPGAATPRPGARENALWLDAAPDSSYFVVLRKKYWSWGWQATVRRANAMSARDKLRRARMVPSTEPAPLASQTAR